MSLRLQLYEESKVEVKPCTLPRDHIDLTESIDKLVAMSKRKEQNPILVDPFPPGIKLAWAMPHDQTLISTATHHSLLCVARPEQIAYMTANKGGDLATKRELQVQSAIRAGATHIWLIDGDMVYPNDILIRLFKLLENGADMAGGLCYRGYPPYDPIAKHLTENRMMLPYFDFEFGDIIKPRATGAACLLVKKEVFEGLSEPWFKTIYDVNNPVKVTQTEDIFFTQKATEAGFALWIDTSIDVDHVREFGVNREMYFLHQLSIRLNGMNGDGKERIKQLLNKTGDPGWLYGVLDPILSDRVVEKEKPLESEILVSAIVSAYRSSKFMRGCLEDLVSQTLFERGQVEIIVVDSGSDENEKEIVEEFQKKYSGIKYLRTDHETVYAAWNRGIKIASGRYITNANTDDRHDPNSFEKMVSVLESDSDLSLVYADVIITEKENETFSDHTPVGKFNWYEWDRSVLLNLGCFVGPQPMWRRSIHDEYGYFDGSMVTSGDYEFWLRISQTHPFKHISEPLGLYLRSPNGREHRSWREKITENAKIMLEYLDAENSGKIIKQVKS